MVLLSFGLFVGCQTNPADSAEHKNLMKEHEKMEAEHKKLAKQHAEMEAMHKKMVATHENVRLFNGEATNSNQLFASCHCCQKVVATVRKNAQSKPTETTYRDCAV